MSAIPKPMRQPRATPPPEKMRPNPSSEQHLILRNVSWESYLVIGDALPDRPNLRMTYDGENLEFMTLSPEHEIYKARFSRLLETLAEECNLKIAPAGSTTFRPEA